MKVIQCIEPGKLIIGQKDFPVKKPGCAIIKIHRIGICGTDLHAYEGVQPYFSYPRILGHELSGEIVDIDLNDEFKTGDRVTVIPYLHCGKCISCNNGKPNCCLNISVCGVHQDGGMAEFLSVPVYALIKGNEIELDALALVEPLAIGAHGIRRSGMQENDLALIIGAGPIGLATAAMAKAKNAKVILVDINEHRLKVAHEKFGINNIIVATDPKINNIILDMNNGSMPMYVFDCTGNLNAINKGFSFLEHGGTYVLIGLQRGEIIVNHPEFHKREATLMSSRNATREDFDLVMNCILNQFIKPLDFITHRVPFDNVIEAFPTWLDPSNKVIKAMIELRNNDLKLMP